MAGQCPPNWVVPSRHFALLKFAQLRQFPIEPVETVNALYSAIVVSFVSSLLIVFVLCLGYSAALPLSMLAN